ncbi:hypothetical protein EWB00_009116, partial [Schistosoma japonicum]
GYYDLCHKFKKYSLSDVHQGYLFKVWEVYMERMREACRTSYEGCASRRSMPVSTFISSIYFHIINDFNVIRNVW